jgi:hypothetical protein
MLLSLQSAWNTDFGDRGVDHIAPIFPFQTLLVTPW